MPPFASYMVETGITLVAVIALAILVLYGAKRFGGGQATGPLELVGRLPIDARRAVYLVRAGKVVLVVGASEGGLTRLGEIDASEVPAVREDARTFRGVLAKVIGAPASTPEPREETRDA